MTSLDLSANINLTTLMIDPQESTITIDEKTMTAAFPAGVDLSRVSVLFGATLSGNILMIEEGAPNVTYTYETRDLNQTVFGVQLWIENPHTHDFPEATHECTCGLIKHSFDETTHECSCGATNHSFDAETYVCSCGAVVVNETTFPDEIFRNIVLSDEFDMDQDGLLSPVEIADFKILHFNNLGLSDLTGIEYFTELFEFEAKNNNFTTLDLSGLSKLESLWLDSNFDLVSLDLQGCTSLTILNLPGCRNLATLNLQDCGALQHLNLENCSKLVDSLNVSHLFELTYLNVTDIYLFELDLSNNMLLENLLIGGTGLTSLDLSNNTELNWLDGKSRRNIKHCKVGYLNMNLFGDVTKMKNFGGGTLEEDGWLKLDEYVDRITYDYITGVEGCDLSVTLTFHDAYVEQHSHKDQIVGKDETEHYTKACELCRTVDETSVVAHTFENGVCTGCSYACPHDVISAEGICPHCNKQYGFSVTLGEDVFFFDDVIEAFTKAREGTAQTVGGIKLLADVTYTGGRSAGIGNGDHVTLDLNGFALDFGSNSYILNNGTFVLCDGKGGGALIGSSGSVISNMGSFTLTSGAVTYNGPAPSGMAIYNGGELVINGGTVSSAGDAIQSRDGIVTINGGTIIANGGLGIENLGATLIINAGEIKGFVDGIENRGTLEMTGGTVSGVAGIFNYGGSATISGGTVATDLVNGVGIWVQGGTATVSGTAEIKALYNLGRGIYNPGGTVYVQGGTITAAGENAIGIENESTLILSGGTVAGGITTKVGTLADCLAAGHLYYDENGNRITLAEGQTEITEQVTVVACTHDFSGAYLSDPAGHLRECVNCGVAEAKAAHTYGADSVCTVCDYACTHITHSDAGVCADCRKQRGFSVTLGEDVFFFDDVTEAFTKASEGTAQTVGAIKLLADVTYTGSSDANVPNGAQVILDLDGFTLDMGSCGIMNYGTFELCDGKGGGAVVGTGRFVIYNGRRFTLTSGTVSNRNTEWEMYAIRNGNVGEMIMNGGTVSGVMGGIHILTGGTVTVNGGTVIGIENSAIELYGYAALTVNGGEIRGDHASGIYNIGDGTVNMTGGTVSGSDGILCKNGTVTISGGTVLSDRAGGGAIYVHGGTVTVSGTAEIKALYNFGRGIYNPGGTVYVQGGTITASGNGSIAIDIDNSALILSGGTVTGGINTEGGITLLDCLAAGYFLYGEGGDLITLTEDQTEITEQVTVSACRHDFSGDYLFDPEGHWRECANCDATETKAPHTYGADGKCVCGDERAAVIELQITWTSTEFTYVEGEWNPETHEQTGEWQGACEITLLNTGTQAATYKITYANSRTDIFGVFSTAELPSATEIEDVLAVGEETTVVFKPSGKPSEALSNEKIGTITIQLGGD